MAQHSGQSMALLLNAEIAGVLASMRQNSKWSLVPMRYTTVRERCHQAPPHRHAALASRSDTRSSASKRALVTVSTHFACTQEDDLGDEPLLEDFRLLRRRIFKWGGKRPPAAGCW